MAALIASQLPEDDADALDILTLAAEIIMRIGKAEPQKPPIRLVSKLDRRA